MNGWKWGRTLSTLIYGYKWMQNLQRLSSIKPQNCDKLICPVRNIQFVKWMGNNLWQTHSSTLLSFFIEHSRGDEDQVEIVATHIYFEYNSKDEGKAIGSNIGLEYKFGILFVVTCVNIWRHPQNNLHAPRPSAKPFSEVTLNWNGKTLLHPKIIYGRIVR